MYTPIVRSLLTVISLAPSVVIAAVPQDPAHLVPLIDLGNDLLANGALIAEHGWRALMDGGLRQLLELLLTGYASMAAYVVLKACEFSLVRQIVTPSSRAEP
jgi:hypothetical protein